MDELGLNPFSAAKQAGLGRDYVRDIIRGKVKHPSPGKLRDLAVALKCSTDFLIGDSDETGAPPATFEGPNRPAKLKVERVVKSGFYATHKTPIVDKEVAYWVVSAGFDMAEWLERVDDSQLDGEISQGSLIHVVEPSEYYHGLTDLVLVEEIRGEGVYRLIERSVRRIAFNSRGVELSGLHKTFRWDELASEEGSTGQIGGPNRYLEGSEEHLPVRQTIKIVGLVLRSYRFYDRGLGIEVPF